VNLSQDKASKKRRSSLLRNSGANFERGTIALIETNVDDITGEILSRTIERLLAEGAEDATAIAYLGKKGREGFTVRVVCSTSSAQRIAEVLVEETGTLGVKMTEYSRLIVPRRIVSIPFSTGEYNGTVRVKIAKFNGQILRIKPELEDARKIADSNKIPLRHILDQITSAAGKYLQDSPELIYQEKANRFAQGNQK
jgi:pyridinium-3,5-bisthiocarboxylic acid mononucleotide nickel chelatase